jgi:protein-disulfide isomerase
MVGVSHVMRCVAHDMVRLTHSMGETTEGSTASAEQPPAVTDALARLMLRPAQMKNTVNKWVKPLHRPLGAAFGAAVFVSIAVAACAAGETPGVPGESAETAPNADLFNGIPQHGNELGDPNAPVTLVELSDLQCPFCRVFDTDMLPIVVDRYVRTGKVRIVLHNLPILGPDSVRAARVADAAALQDRLFPFVDMFFHNQGRERTGYVTDTFLRSIGARVRGLDVERAMNERGSQRVDQQLMAAQRLALELRLNGVPWFLAGRTGGEMKTVNVIVGQPDTITGPIDAILAQQ